MDPLYWSPARMSFASFKLLAWALLRKHPRSKPRKDVDRVVVRMAPGRNGVEVFTVAIAHFALALSWMYALIEPWVRKWPVFFVLLSPVVLVAGLVATQTAVFLICLAVERSRHVLGLAPSVRMNAAAVTASTIAISLWMVARGGWSRWPGWLWLAMLALNLLCAGIAFFMRERLRALEIEIERGATFAA